MVSVVFDKLWDEAYAKEGELLTHASALAKVYGIASAMESIRMARGLAEHGREFFEYCDAIYRVRRDRALERLRRRGQLHQQDVVFIKVLIDKAMKGWW